MRKRIWFAALSVLLCAALISCAAAPVQEQETEIETAEEATETQEEKKELSFGVYEKGVYINEYIDLACVLGSEWEVMEPHAQQELHDLFMDSVAGEVVGDIGEYEPIPALKASISTDMSSININYIKAAPGDTSETAVSFMYDEEFKTITEESLEQMGMEDITLSYMDVPFCGETVKAAVISFSAADISMKELMVMRYNEGDAYMTQILTLAADEASAAMLLDRFCLIDDIPAEAWEEETDRSAVESAAPYGSFEDGVYTNAYAGISIQLPEGWTYSPAEQLEEELLEDGTSYIAMQAQSAEFSGITVHFQKFPEAEVAMYRTISREDAVDIMLSMKDQLIESYAQSGLEVTVLDKRYVEYLGSEQPAVYCSGTLMGMEYHSVQIIDYTLGAYSISIELMSIGSDATAELLKLIQPL